MQLNNHIIRNKNTGTRGNAKSLIKIQVKIHFVIRHIKYCLVCKTSLRMTNYEILKMNE